MIYVLLGKSCSGKTTVLNHLTTILNKEKVVAATTRPIRPNETDGIDYHFISNGEYQTLMEQGKLICPRVFVSYKGDLWRYALLKSSLDIEKDLFLILDPLGFKELKAQYPSKVRGIYLNVSDEVLIQRGLKRGDHYGELERRLAADKSDFLNFENEVNYVINNNEDSSVIDEVLKVVSDLE